MATAVATAVAEVELHRAHMVTVEAATAAKGDIAVDNRANRFRGHTVQIRFLRLHPRKSHCVSSW